MNRKGYRVIATKNLSDTKGNTRETILIDEFYTTKAPAMQRYGELSALSVISQNGYSEVFLVLSHEDLICSVKGPGRAN